MSPLEICRLTLKGLCSEVSISSSGTWWLSVQVGGFMRDENAFRRVILRYSCNGQVESLTEEVYRPPGVMAPDSPSAGPH